VPLALVFGGVAVQLTWPGITATQAWTICAILLAVHFILKVPALRGRPRVIIGVIVAFSAIVSYPLLRQLHADAVEVFDAANRAFEASKAARQAAAQAANARHRTKPIYDPESDDDIYTVLECERDAIEVGNLNSTFPNRPWATSSFRKCLIARGLAWEECEVGDDGCSYLDHMWSLGRFPVRSRFVPSHEFMVAPYRRR